MIWRSDRYAKQKTDVWNERRSGAVVGEMMTPALVLKIGAALGSMRKGTIAVGRDTRTSGEALVHALKAGLLDDGVRRGGHGHPPHTGPAVHHKDRMTGSRWRDDHRIS